ncbi:MAG: hypothetical protein IJ654_02270 [Bacteroidales bacterium]|nr:hypothetical protein [Bacteroidales bacterium]
MMKWLHNLLKGASLTTALFIFQACYGVPQPALVEFGWAPMSFSLVSDRTGEPLEGIRVKGKAIQDDVEYVELGVTDADGRCQVGIPYERNELGPYLRFEDPSGQVAPKDTMLADLREREIVIRLNPQGQ